MQILAVVVRYKVPLEKSETMQSFVRAMGESPDLGATYHLLIWDNSPEPLTWEDAKDSPFKTSYHHALQNSGTSGAYNGAMGFAEQHGFPWMMLLDQDTTLSVAFLHAMADHAAHLLSMTEIAAIAPTVHVGAVVVSPKQQMFNRSRTYPLSECGIATGEAIAINSGCVMRVAALRTIGGFSLEFWLDYSDLYVFHQFFRHGLRVWRAANAPLQHEMSIMDYDRLMTPWRYQNFSDAETAFHDLYKGRIENAIQTLRLFARAIKQRFKYENPEFSRIAWRQWLYRMRTTRKQRLVRWRMESLRRLG